MARLGPLREGGRYAIEVHQEMREVDYSRGRFEVVECVVVYADRAEPSHSVRIFLPKVE